MKILPDKFGDMVGKALHGAEKVNVATPGRVPTAETTVVMPTSPGQGRIVPGRHRDIQFNSNGMDYEIYAGGEYRGKNNLLDDLAKAFTINTKAYKDLPNLDAVNFVDENGNLLGRIVRDKNRWVRGNIS